MPPVREPRILLVEDEPQVYRTLQRRLQSEHYAVTLAPTYDEAYARLRSEHFHLAIIDIRLNAADETDQSGLQLLKDMTDFKLNGIMPCIVITAIGTLSIKIPALSSLREARFIQKEPGYISQLQDAIRELLGEYRLSFSLEYVADTPQKIKQGAEYIWSREPDWPQPDQLTPQIEDLLSKLFYDARRLFIDHIYRGLSGSFVVEARPLWPDGLGQSKIVKIGRRNKTQTELTNYLRHVEPFLPSQHATHVNSAYTRHLGALLYTFFGIQAGNTIDFETYYQQHTPDQITAALRRLFGDTCQSWYQNRTPPDFESLRDLYFDTFNLSYQPDRLYNEILSLRPDYQPETTSLSFDDLGLSLPNPLHWLNNDAATVMPVCRSITHGDLHAGNILMNNNGDCWLIDFYRTNQSHILRDFVELETDIKFRLLDQLPLPEFCQFEQALIRAEHPQQPVELPSEFPDSVHKAVHVIGGLRAQAWNLLGATQRNPRLIQREYLTSLLMGTLNILRLRHFKQDPALQPRRELALLSAALICEHLQ